MIHQTQEAKTIKNPSKANNMAISSETDMQEL